MKKPPPKKIKAALQQYAVALLIECLDIDLAGLFPWTERGGKYKCLKYTVNQKGLKRI